MIFHHTLNFSQLWRRVAHAARHRRIVQPHLGSCWAFVYMDMRRLVRFVAVEVQPEPVNSQNRGHLLWQRLWVQGGRFMVPV